jgi:hypothetical protein
MRQAVVGLLYCGFIVAWCNWLKDLAFASSLTWRLFTTCKAPAVRAMRVAAPLCGGTLVCPSRVTTPC